MSSSSQSSSSSSQSSSPSSSSSLSAATNFSFQMISQHMPHKEELINLYQKAYPKEYKEDMERKLAPEQMISRILDVIVSLEGPVKISGKNDTPPNCNDTPPNCNNISSSCGNISSSCSDLPNNESFTNILKQMKDLEELMKNFTH